MAQTQILNRVRDIFVIKLTFSFVHVTPGRCSCARRHHWQLEISSVVRSLRWRTDMGKRYTIEAIQLTTGANDCKNNLLAILDAFEFLLENDFRPKRTILAGFGFDEEIRFISDFHF